MKTLRASALLLAATLAAACGDGGTGASDRDRFEGLVTGDISASLQGSAVSEFDPAFGDQILLTDFDAQVEVLIVNLDADFVEGTQTLPDATDPALNTGVIAFIYFATADRLFLSEGGLIELNDVTSAGIRGAIDFDAVEVDPDTFDPMFDQVRVQATFSTDDRPGSINSRSPAPAAVLSRIRAR